MSFRMRKGRASFSVSKRGPRAGYRMGCLLPLALIAVACGGAGLPVTVAPTREPAEVTTPEAEPEPVYEVGTGLITFGTTYDEDTLEIPKPLTRFKRTYPEIAWSASFWREPDATSLTWVLARTSASGAEETLYNEEQSIGSPDYVTIANSADLAFLVDNKAGTYIMRYIESGDVLAEGTFTLVK